MSQLTKNDYTCSNFVGSECKQNSYLPRQNTMKRATTTRTSQKSANFYMNSNASDSLGFSNSNVSQITPIQYSLEFSISHSSLSPCRIYFAGDGNLISTLRLSFRLSLYDRIARSILIYDVKDTRDEGSGSNQTLISVLRWYVCFSFDINA